MWACQLSFSSINNQSNLTGDTDDDDDDDDDDDRLYLSVNSI